jgi:hypothetical protein
MTKRTLIAVAITSIITLLAGLLLITNSTNAETQESSLQEVLGNAKVLTAEERNLTREAVDAEVIATGENPRQAAPHAIAACIIFDEADYTLRLLNFPIAQKLLTLGEEQAALAASFDSRWNNLHANFYAVAKTQDIAAFATGVIANSLESEPFLIMNEIMVDCRTPGRMQVTTDMAKTVACVEIEKWRSFLPTGEYLYANLPYPFPLDYEYSLLSRTTLSDGTVDEEFYQNTLNLHAALDRKDISQSNEFYESISADCAAYATTSIRYLPNDRYNGSSTIPRTFYSDRGPKIKLGSL